MIDLDEEQKQAREDVDRILREFFGDLNAAQGLPRADLERPAETTQNTTPPEETK